MKISILHKSKVYDFYFSAIDENKHISPEITLRNCMLFAIQECEGDIQRVIKFLNKKNLNINVYEINKN